MANVKIQGYTINIDIEAELQEFEWDRPRWSSGKLIAASPFRYDRTPSFFVNLDGDLAGVWGDSGAYEDDWKSGGIVKLLAYLRNETVEESSEYLLGKYGNFNSDEEFRLILPKFPNYSCKRILPCDIITVVTSPYLTKRAISTEVQAQSKVGKSRHKRFVAIPWYAPDGSLANVKYRATKGKAFFYEKGATPIGELVYGADLYVKSSGDLIVCEAEIDALSWRTAGYNAVALGGVAVTPQKISILQRIPFTRLVVAGDNDKAGVKFNSRVVQAFKGCDLAVIDWEGSNFKDANEVLVRCGTEALRGVFMKAKEIPTFDVEIQNIN